MKATIHVLKSQLGLNDDNYRDFLQAQTGVRSSKDLSVAQAGRVIERMREVAGERPAQGAVAGLDTPIGGKLRALWIAGYNLGIVRARDDKAMLAFVERITGVSHIRFLKDARDASNAIEGLKSWLAREPAGVQWPANSEDIIANKRAVLDAQWRRLIELGDIKAVGSVVDAMDGLQFYATKIARQNRWETMRAHDYDEAQKALGNKLRGALARQAGETRR